MATSNPLTEVQSSAIPYGMIPESSPVPAAHPLGRPVSRAEQARALGLSLRQLYYLLAAERRGEAEWARPAPPPDPADLPHVPITDGPAEGYHYRLDAPALSRLPSGPLRIGEGGRPDGGSRRAAGPGRLEGRIGIHHPEEVLGERVDPTRKPAPKFKPKRPPRKKDRPS